MGRYSHPHDSDHHSRHHSTLHHYSDHHRRLLSVPCFCPLHSLRLSFLPFPYLPCLPRLHAPSLCPCLLWDLPPLCLLCLPFLPPRLVPHLSARQSAFYAPS